MSADHGLADDPHELAGIAEIGPVDRADDVALLHARAPGGAARIDIRDDRAALPRQAERVHHVGRHVLQRDADPAGAHLAILQQPVHHEFRVVRGDGEAEPDRAAIRHGEKRGIDTHDLAFEIDERATGIAVIDGGVGLDVVVIGAVVDVAVERAHDPRAHRHAEPERIADREHRIADLQIAAVGPGERVQLVRHVHLEDGEIDRTAFREQARPGPAAIAEMHGDLQRAIDHVLVRDDHARWVDDEARPEEVRPVGPPCRRHRAASPRPRAPRRRY